MCAHRLKFAFTQSVFTAYLWGDAFMKRADVGDKSVRRGGAYTILPLKLNLLCRKVSATIKTVPTEVSPQSECLRAKSS